MNDKKNIFNFENIIYEISSTRCINGLSGEFKSGGISIIKGDSDSGKSCFLRILTGRIPEEVKTFGKVLYNGNERSWSDWSNKISVTDFNRNNFVIVDDNTLRNLIYELLPSKSVEKKNIIADDIINKASKHDFNGSELETFYNLQLSLLSKPEILIIDHFDENLTDYVKEVFFDFFNNYAIENNSIVILCAKKFKDDFFYKSKSVIHMSKKGIIYQGDVEKLDTFFYDKGINYPKTISMQDYIDRLYETPGVEIVDDHSLDKIILQNNIKNQESINLATPVSKNNILIPTKKFSFINLLRLLKDSTVVFTHLTSLILLSIYITAITLFVLCIINNSSLDFIFDLKSAINESKKSFTQTESFFIAYLWFRNNFLPSITVLTVINFQKISIEALYDQNLYTYSYVISHMLTYGFFSYLINSLVIILTYYYRFSDILDSGILFKTLLIGNIYLATLIIMYLILGLFIESYWKILGFISVYTYYTVDWINKILSITSSNINYLTYILFLDPIYHLNGYFEGSLFNEVIKDIKNNEDISTLSLIYLQVNYTALDSIQKNLNLTTPIKESIKNGKFDIYDIFLDLGFTSILKNPLLVFVILYLIYNALYFILQVKKIRLNIRLKLN